MCECSIRANDMMIRARSTLHAPEDGSYSFHVPLPLSYVEFNVWNFASNSLAVIKFSKVFMVGNVA